MVASDGHFPLTTLTEGELKFQQQVRLFSENEIRPLSREMDEKARLPDSLLEKLFQQGLLSVEVPVEYGGAGLSDFYTTLAIEELARVDSAVAVLADVQNVLVIQALRNHGSEALRQHYLPLLARDTIGAFCLSEQESGSDAFSLKSIAKETDDGFLLSGTKHWVTNAAEAKVFIIAANTTPEKGAFGITLFMVDRTTQGIVIGERIDKLGIRASSTCPVELQDVFVHKSQVLGTVGGGYNTIIDILNKGRIGIAAQMVGLAQGAFEASLTYAKSRRQFGHAIGSFQGVQFDIADMAVQLEAARLLTYNAARMAEHNCNFIDLQIAAVKAKYFAAEVAEKVASKTVEIHGGIGFTRAYPVERFYRDAKIGSIYEGTSNMLKRTIATKLLGAVR